MLACSAMVVSIEGQRLKVEDHHFCMYTAPRKFMYSRGIVSVLVQYPWCLVFDGLITLLTVIRHEMNSLL